MNSWYFEIITQFYVWNNLNLIILFIFNYLIITFILLKKWAHIILILNITTYNYYKKIILIIRNKTRVDEYHFFINNYI